VRIALEIPDELYRELEQRAAKRGVSLELLITDLISAALGGGRQDLPPTLDLDTKLPLLKKEELREAEAGELERYARSLGH